MQTLGKWTWTTFYENEWVYYIRTRDYTKELYDVSNWFRRNYSDFKYFQNLKFIEIDNQWRKIYSTIFYEPLKASHTVAWSQYKALKENLQEVDKWQQSWNTNNSIDKCWQFIALIKEDQRIPTDMVNEIELHVEAICNYTSVPCIEISPRNLKVQENGELMLLDIFFDINLNDKTAN